MTHTFIRREKVAVTAAFKRKISYFVVYYVKMNLLGRSFRHNPCFIPPVFGALAENIRLDILPEYSVVY